MNHDEATFFSIISIMVINKIKINKSGSLMLAQPDLAEIHYFKEVC